MAVPDLLFPNHARAGFCRILMADIGRSRRFSKGVGDFKCKFLVEGDIAHQPFLVSEN